METAISQIISDLRPVRRPARVLYGGAVVFLLSAAIHLGALVLDEWRWSGAVSFRKPLVFSVSMGLLLVTVGWVLDRLPDRPRLAGTLAWTFLVSSTVEVGLIAVQTWRGRLPLQRIRVGQRHGLYRHGGVRRVHVTMSGRHPDLVDHPTAG